MIGALGRGNDFAATARYLTEKDQARVEWEATRGMMHEESRAVAEEMQQTFDDAETRAESSVLHFKFSAHPDDDLSREDFEALVDESLDELGLGEHEAFYVAHNDRPHDHVHAMVSSINARTEKAWNDSWSRYKMRQAMERQELKRGLTRTGKNLTRAHSHTQGKTMADTKEITDYSQDFRSRLDSARAGIESAGSQQEFEAALEGEGLSFDADAEAISRGDEGINADRLVEAYKEHEASGLADVAKEGSLDRDAPALNASESVREVTKERVSKQGKGAAAAELAAEAIDGPAQDEDDMMRKGAQVGRIGARMAARRHMTETVREVYRDDRSGKEVLAEDAEKYAEREELEQVASELNTSQEKMTKALDDDNLARAGGQKAETKFTQELEAAYDNPAEARGAFAERAKAKGHAEAAQDMRNTPEDFGRLKDDNASAWQRLSGSRSQEGARQAAREAAGHGKAMHEWRARQMDGAARGKMEDKLKDVKQRASKANDALSKGEKAKRVMKRMKTRVQSLGKEATASVANSVGGRPAAAIRSAAKAVGFGRSRDGRSL